jgi:hypothetical protein
MNYALKTSLESLVIKQAGQNGCGPTSQLPGKILRPVHIHTRGCAFGGGDGDERDGSLLSERFMIQMKLFAECGARPGASDISVLTVDMG